MGEGLVGGVEEGEGGMSLVAGGREKGGGGLFF